MLIGSKPKIDMPLQRIQGFRGKGEGDPARRHQQYRGPCLAKFPSPSSLIINFALQCNGLITILTSLRMVQVSHEFDEFQLLEGGPSLLFLILGIVKWSVLYCAFVAKQMTYRLIYIH